MTRATTSRIEDTTESKLCGQCGGLFYRDNRCTYAYWSRARFCSSPCAGKFNSAVADRRRPSFADRFFRQVSKSDGCWHWTGLVDKDGYGLMPYKRKMWRANVASLAIDGRPTSPGQYACHTCDNPPCVNPAHLYPGTPTQNMDDARRRGRICAGENRPQSKLTAGQVQIIRQSTLTVVALGKAFGVSHSNISMIRSRRTWKHVP
jgi:hypothetical protein